MSSNPVLPLVLSVAALSASTLVLADSEGDVQLEAIVVTASADASAQGVQPAYAGGQVARGGRVGIFGSQDIMDTPFSITNFTQKLVQDTQAASVGDVLQNDGAVRVARGFGNFQQLYIVRGLPVYSDDMSYNGLYGLLPRQYLAAELVERVEVLHGASAFLNGAAPGGSGLGGAVNVSPKRAPNAPLAEFTVGTESGSQTYLAADIAHRFGPEENFGIRLNAVRRNGGTAVDGEHRTLTVGSVGLDFHIQALRVSADIGYQNHQLDRSQPSVTPTGTDIPPAPNADQPIGQPWTFSNERDTFGTLRAEYDILPSLTAWVAGGIRDGHEAAVFGNPTVIAADGTTSTYRFDNARHDKVETGEFGLRYHLEVFGIKQQLIASAAAYELNSENAYAFSSFAGFTGNLYVPAVVPAPAADFFTGGLLSDPLTTARTKTRSVALADQVALLDDALLVSVGGRYQRIEALNYDYNSGDSLNSYSKSRITPVAGVLYKFNKMVSVYGNYIEGLVAGDTAPNTYTDPAGGSHAVTNAGEIFKPYATRQGEVGAKYDGGNFGTTFSLFYTTKPVSGVDYATGTYEVTDYVRNRGGELSGYGEPFKGVRVLAGLSYLHAELQGKRAIGAPRFQSNAGVEWDLPWLPGLTVDGRALYTTTQYADAGNLQRVPSWTRFDAGARYAFPVGPTTITLRARVDNLTNRNQWVSVGGYPGSGYLVLGDPRTFMVNGTVAF